VQVTYIVEATQGQAALRREHLELIGHHLACTDMHVGIGRDDSYVWVTFPNREKLH
jgi:hypothetical protein